ncbi:MAG: hypothetical protein IT342_14760 [Candidatus Melainabacteria bacterium]|nr:hypothetical protein [Candidatus Melainabacteria bacterium]
MFLIVSAALSAAVGSYVFIMWIAGKQSELGLAALVACVALVPYAARQVWTGADYDLFDLIWLLSMIFFAVIDLIARSLK